MASKPQNLRRKPHVPDDVRTPDKDDAADYIEEEIVEKDRWPMNYTDIAEETEWSRQHITNTIRDYFEGVQDNGARHTKRAVDSNRISLDIAIPADIEDEEAFLRGYIQGWMRREE